MFSFEQLVLSAPVMLAAAEEDYFRHHLSFILPSSESFVFLICRTEIIPCASSGLLWALTWITCGNESLTTALLYKCELFKCILNRLIVVRRGIAHSLSGTYLLWTIMGQSAQPGPWVGPTYCHWICRINTWASPFRVHLLDLLTQAGLPRFSLLNLGLHHRNASFSLL